MSARHFGTAIYAELARERERAHTLHQRNSMESRPVGDYFRYTILAEEVGEVAKEFNEAEARGGVEHLDLERLRTELVQVAAMAAAWADRLDFVLTQRGGGVAQKSGTDRVSPGPLGHAGSRERLDPPAASRGGD